MIAVVAQTIIKDGKKEEYLKYAEKVVAETRKEKGCIVYQCCQSNEDPLKFVMLENWESNEFLEAHMQTGHMKEYKAQIAELTAEKPPVELYSVTF